MSIRDGHSAFRHTPYPRPNSTHSSSGKVPSNGKRGSQTPSASSSRLEQVLDDLNTDSTLRGSNSEFLKTRRAVAKYNFAVRDQEITLQQEENAAKHANAEADFQRQAKLKKLDIQMSKQQERTVDKKVKLINLKIRLAQLQSGNSGGPAINIGDENDMEDDDEEEDVGDADLGDMNLEDDFDLGGAY